MKKQKKNSPMPDALRAEAESHETPPARLEELYYRFPAVSREVIAQNPNTPPTLLEKLSQVKALQPLIAQNPNTPMATLYELWATHPMRLLQNPALALWLLESPDFWGALPERVQAALARLGSLEPDLLRTLWRSGAHSARVGILGNPRAPVDILEAGASEQYLAQSVAMRHDLTESIWLQLLGSPSPTTRAQAEKNPTKPERLFSLCKRLGWLSAWSGYAKRELDDHLTEDDLTLLASGGPYLQLLVVKHPKVTAEVLARLSLSKDVALLQAVAQHPNSSDEVLLTLLRRSAQGCALLIAQRPGLSPALGRAILQHPDGSGSFSRALQALASNPSTPTVVLLTLLREHGRHCGQQLFAREALPREVIRAAVESRRPFLQLALVARAELLPDDLAALSRSAVVAVRVLVAKHAKTSPETRARLAWDESPEVRAALGGSPLDDAQLLLISARSQDPLTCRGLLQHQELPPEVWRALLHDAKPAIVEEAFSHEGFPRDWRSLIEGARAQRELSREEQAALRALGWFGARLLESYYREPRWLLEALYAQTPLWSLREAASHPSAPGALRRWCRALHPTEPFKVAPATACAPARGEALRQLRGVPSPEQLEGLMLCKDILVRRALAMSAKAPLVFLLSVIFEGSLGEQLALSRNPSLPSDLKRWVALHPRLRAVNL